MTAALVLPVLALLGALEPAQLEAQGALRLAEVFERAGRAPPERDAALDQAARALAQIALDEGAVGAADLLTLTEALSAAGASDAAPRALVLRGSPRTEPLAALGRQADLTGEPASHVGVGAVARDDTAAVVVLLSERKASLSPFPRALLRKGSARLCVQLVERLRAPEVYVTRPDGSVLRLETTTREQARCAEVAFEAAGRYTLEVLARGEKGPEVAALFFTDVGAARPARGDRARPAEPVDPIEARARLLLKLNALRRGSGLSGLSADPGLDAVAQAYAERMAAEGFFAHVAPDGLDLRARLKAAGYGYRAAGENLGLAGGPMAAHFAIEHSPAHRKNLQEPLYTHVGFGLARNGQGNTVLVEVLAQPVEARAGEPPLEQAYAALAAGRRSRGLTALRRDPVLEALAQEHARRALQEQTPSAKLPGSALYDKAFAARPEATSVAADVFVAESAALVTASKNLSEPRQSMVGVGVVRGDSPRYGADRFWVVVLYASTLVQQEKTP